MTPRLSELLRLIRRHAPTTGEQLAEMLGVSRPTLRSDLALLVMLGLVEAKPKVGYFPGKRLDREPPEIAALAGRHVGDSMGLPEVVRDTSTVGDVVVAMFTRDVGSLAVVDDEGWLVGVVSRKDLLKVLIGGVHTTQLPVTMAMTRHPHVIVASPDDLLVDAARKMIRYQIDGLPVVKPGTDATGQPRWEVVGRVTKTTVTKAFADAFSALEAPEN